MDTIPLSVLIMPTHATRLTRIFTFLDEAAERFQIVLLISHPECYRGLPKAEFFDLEHATQSGKLRQANTQDSR